MTNRNSSEKLLILDHNRPRMRVEQEKLTEYFPQFRFVAKTGTSKIIGVIGKIKTGKNNVYTIRITLPYDYPLSKPLMSLSETTIEANCPHNEYACGEWKIDYSLAFVIAKTAVWLNKYDYWKETGRWPGNN